MLLPAAGVFLFNALSVKTSSLLLAISAMDPEIIGKVINKQISTPNKNVNEPSRGVVRAARVFLGLFFMRQIRLFQTSASLSCNSADTIYI